MNVDHKSRNSNNICNSNEDFELRKGSWTLEEDNLLIKYIDAHGGGRWNALAKCAGLRRTGKSCRLRWLNYLKPDTRRGNLTPQEQLMILELHFEWGNRWSKIPEKLPGRTDNEIKNFWRTRVQKQARQLNVDADSKKFLETLKCYWIPRLLERVDHQNNASFSSPPSSSTISPIENQDSTLSHFSNSHEILKSVSSNSTFFQNNVHQEKSNLSHYSNNNYPPEYQKTMNLQEIQENEVELSPSWRNNNMNSSQSDCYSTPDVFSYTEECLNQQAMTSSTMGYQECFPEYHISQNNCFNYEKAVPFWNTDDLWQFRHTEEEYTKIDQLFTTQY